MTSPRPPHPVLLATVIAVSLLGKLAMAAGTPTEERLQRIKTDIVALKASVNRGEQDAARKLGSRIEDELAELHQDIVALPPLRLSVGKETAVLKYLGDRVPSARLAGDLVTQEGISEDLAALHAQVIAQRRYRLNELQEVSLRFYPPGDVFIVQDIDGGKKKTALDFLALVDRPQRFSAVLSRAVTIEAAWTQADQLKLNVHPDIARRLAMSGDKLPVSYLHTGVVSPQGSAGRSYPELLQEIQAQLEYIVNVKIEGPPLLAVLRTGLFFDEEFGFEAWGGRWPEFAGTAFLLRYDAARDEFLVTLERLHQPSSMDR